MPSTPTPREHRQNPWLRGSKSVPGGITARRGHGEVRPDAAPTGSRVPAALAPVPAPTTLLVFHAAGDAGRAALRHAIGAPARRLVIVELWESVDPVCAEYRGGGAGFSGAAGAGAALVQSVHRENERRQAAAEHRGATAVATAREHGREAISVVRRAVGEGSEEVLLRQLAAGYPRPHLVLAAVERERWVRLLRGPGCAARIAANPPCPCTVVPGDDG